MDKEKIYQNLVGFKAEIEIVVECQEKGISVEAHNEGDDGMALFGIGALLASLEDEKGYGYENMIETIKRGYITGKMQQEAKKK